MASKGLGASPGLNAPELGGAVLRRGQDRGAVCRKDCRAHPMSMASKGLGAGPGLDAPELGGAVIRRGQDRGAVCKERRR